MTARATDAATGTRVPGTVLWAVELVLLGAIWGASFLFMRIGAPEFGALATSFLRLAVGAAVLLPLVAHRGELALLRRHGIAIGVVGIVNSAIPFTLFAFATLWLPAGFTSILNATAPLWGALVAWAWLGEKPSPARGLGVAIGFGGVVWLASGKLAPAGLSAEALGVVAGIAAGAMYGLAANLTRRTLAGVAPLAVAAGSQLAAATVLAPLAAWAWPGATPSGTAWAAIAALGVLCTGTAYLLYFRLIAQVGAQRATTVAYLIPVFGVAWGAAVLGEAVTGEMVAAGGVILLGTALATGALHGRRKP